VDVIGKPHIIIMVFPFCNGAGQFPGDVANLDEIFTIPVTNGKII
jgi:hypothetical protein